MAANKGQGRTFVFFLAGITTTCAGGAYFGSGVGKLALIVGLAMLLASFVGGIKLKPLEGKTAEKGQSAVKRLLGLAFALGGWIIAVVGVNVASANAARLIAVLIGIGVTLVGVIGILPKASAEGAIWKG
jgi:hypothetical protein